MNRSLRSYSISVAVLLLCIRGESHSPMYQLRAVWYPNVTHSPLPPSDCPVLTPGSDAVNTNYRDNTIHLRGPALQLQTGEHADVTPPVTSDDVICWVFLLRGGGEGTVVEFIMDNPEHFFRVTFDYSRDDVTVYRVSPSETTFDEDNYKVQSSTAWHTVAFGFKSTGNIYAVWNGKKSKKNFDRDDIPYTTLPSLIPAGLRLGTSRNGDRNSRMEVSCLMLFSFTDFDDLLDMRSSDMDDLLHHCKTVSDGSVVGCVDGHIYHTTTTTTSPPPITTFTEDTTTVRESTTVRDTTYNQETTANEHTTSKAETPTIEDTAIPNTTILENTTPVTSARGTTVPGHIVPEIAAKDFTVPDTSTQDSLKDETTPTQTPVQESSHTTTQDVIKGETTPMQAPVQEPSNYNLLQRGAVTIHASLPVCFCTREYTNTTSGPSQADKYSKELELDSSQLSASLRRKQSARDVRPSAQYVGFVGMTFVVFVLGIVFVFDVSSLAQRGVCAVCGRARSR